MQILHIAPKNLDSLHLATARARAIVQMRIAFSFQSNTISYLYYTVPVKCKLTVPQNFNKST